MSIFHNDIAGENGTDNDDNTGCDNTINGGQGPLLLTRINFNPSMNN